MAAQRRFKPGRWLLPTIVLALLALGVYVDLAEPLGELPEAVVGWIRQSGPLGAAGALYAEESGVPLPLPGDLFVMYIGRHQTTFGGWLVAWVALVIVVVLGSTNLYWVSRRWGRDLLGGRLGRVVHVTPARLSAAEGWFAKYGAWALIFGRHIPGFRVPITVAAGTLRVPYRLFAASVAVSSAMWAGLFLFVGVRFGRHFEDLLRAHRGNYFLVVGGAVLLVAIYLAVRHRDVATPAAEN